MVARKKMQRAAVPACKPDAVVRGNHVVAPTVHDQGRRSVRGRILAGIPGQVKSRGQQEQGVGLEVLAPSKQTLPMSGALLSIARGDYQNKYEDQIKGSGYVVRSLEAALWCFWQTDSFEACVLRAANLGDDADTTAAVAGQLAGAFYGESGIPAKWLGKLALAREIGQWAEQLVLQKPRG